MISSECNGCEYQCKLSHIDICTLGSPCPHQRSTPMTNEEWLKMITTEQLAEWIVHLADDCTMQHECDLCNSWCDEKRVMEWLKQPHTTVKE